MRYLPLQFDLRGKRVVVFGGGRAAEAKLRTLVRTEALIDVVTTAPNGELQRWAEQERISVIDSRPHPSHLGGAALAYAATDDDDLNAAISAWAREAGVPVNAADLTEACDFITPALVDRSPVNIAIGTEGTSPGLARAIKSDLEARLPSDLGETAKAIKFLRDDLKSDEPDIAHRQAIWAAILGAGLNDFSSLTPQTVLERYETARNTNETSGHVHIVGAGPGDPDLLTIGALRVMHSADCIVYDRLVSDDVLSLCRREAEFIYVGKIPGGASTRQEEINRIIVEKALAGETVVRLKSGDPLVFGRAEEEFAAMEQANVAFTLHPGITAATAAAASLRHSLTVRGENTAAMLATGHDENGFAELDWAALAKPNARASIYMGLRAARFIQGRLLLHGADPSHPITVVENASRPDELHLSTSVATLADDLSNSAIKGPAVLMLGYADRRAKHSLRAAS